jgi:DNA-binding MarR family transcriptional regulator
MRLVLRQRAETDRRQVLVELTAAGRRLLDKVRDCRESRLLATLAFLSPHDAEELLRLLTLYLEAFQRQHEDAADGERRQPSESDGAGAR